MGQRVVGKVGVVAGTHDDRLGEVAGINQGTIAISVRLGKGVLLSEHHVVQLHQTGEVVARNHIGDFGLGRLNGLVVGQNHNVTVSLETGKLGKSVVNSVGDILQVHTDGVADAHTRSGVHVKLDGLACLTILHEGSLVEVTRLLVGSDNTINRGILVEHRTRLHIQNLADGVNRSNRKHLDGRFRIILLTRSEHHSQ